MASLHNVPCSLVRQWATEALKRINTARDEKRAQITARDEKRAQIVAKKRNGLFGYRGTDDEVWKKVSSFERMNLDLWQAYREGVILDLLITTKFAEEHGMFTLSLSAEDISALAENNY